MRLSKLVIGGAQFGQSYGIDSSKVNQKEIKKLFNYLKKKIIKLFMIALQIMVIVKKLY